jgi:hypothetical protein
MPNQKLQLGKTRYSALRALLCIAPFSLVWLPAPLRAAAKPKPPDAEALREARRTVEEVYHDELGAAKQPESKAELARKLLREGMRDDGAGGYTLLVLARDLAAEGGDLETAFEAVDQTQKVFEVDALKLKVEAAASAVKGVRDREQAGQFLSRVDPVIEEAVKGDRYEEARRLAELVVTGARKGGDTATAKQSAARMQQVREIESASAEARRGAATLEKRPGDPEANLRLGRFRCLMNGVWESGLPLLAQGADASLTKLAERERAGAAAPQQQVSLGDGWWSESEKLSGLMKRNARARAGHWYELALAKLPEGLTREKVRKRLKEGEDVAGGRGRAGDGKQVPTFVWKDLPRYVNLRLVATWERLRPRTTLQAQTVKDSLTLTKAGSPYLVVGFVAVEPEATLTVEPGVVVLFAPGAQVTSKGMVKMESEEGWIVLAPATRGQKWKGIYCTAGKVTARRCVVVGAESGIWVEHGKDALTASQCFFAGNAKAVRVDGIGNDPVAAVDNCLLFRNEEALSTGGGGGIHYSKCLIASNAKGCTGNYYDHSKGTGSTFLGNELAVEAGIYGEGSEVHGCNILASTKLEAEGRGALNARGNFWGKEMSRAIAARQAAAIRGKVDVLEWLKDPVTDALPALPKCEFITY